MQTEPYPYNRPPWRRSHRAVAPNGSLFAEIAQAFEHSMSNPTVGTLRTSDGLELQKCSPAFIWSDDSKYLAVPQWNRCLAFLLRQRLVIVDIEHRAAYASRFTHWLLQPKTFERGRLEVLVSSNLGIAWGWKEKPLVVDVPQGFSAFVTLKSAYR
jgi:hypothetical protein